LTAAAVSSTLRAVSVPPADRLEITLAGMRFHVRVGILAHERTLAQPLEVDVTLRRAIDSPAVLDYREVYGRTRACLEREPLEYLETIAGDIAGQLLALEGVASVRVAVRKPHVMLDGPLAYAEIVVERQRG
jgi:7,8-dihydroneopterin aldolase/epimerase/oxygenase